MAKKNVSTNVAEKTRRNIFRDILVVGSVVIVVGVIQDASITTTNDREKEVAGLVDELKVESMRGVEYFNSPAFDNLTTRKDAELTNWLKARIKAPNRQSLLPLLALRKVASDTFAQMDSTLKRGILTDALKQAVYFNAWGEPHLFWSEDSSRRLEEPVQAVMEIGEPVIFSLEQLLDEKRRAPRWDSGEGPEPGIAPYQVNDYAIALIHKIEQISTPDPTFVFPNTRGARDTLISNYRGGK